MTKLSVPKFREGSRLDVEVVRWVQRGKSKEAVTTVDLFGSRSDVANEQGNIDAVLFSAVGGDLVSLGSTQVSNQ